MGESIQEATIIRWLKSVGESVAEGEILVEVATDKVDNEVPSPVTGIVKEIRFGEKDLVSIGEVLAVIDADESAVSNVKPETSNEPVKPSTDNRQPSTPVHQPSTINPLNYQYLFCRQGAFDIFALMQNAIYAAVEYPE